MSFQRTIIEGLLKVAKSMHPEYGSLIDFALAHEDQLEQLGPLISDAIKEGPGAYAAAEKAAPDLAAKIREFVSAVPRSADSHDQAKVVIAKHAENVTRQLFGLGDMTADEEQAWMNKSTERLDDSRLGSA